MRMRDQIRCTMPLMEPRKRTRWQTYSQQQPGSRPSFNCPRSLILSSMQVQGHANVHGDSCSPRLVEPVGLSVDIDHASFEGLLMFSSGLSLSSLHHKIGFHDVSKMGICLPGWKYTALLMTFSQMQPSSSFLPHRHRRL